MGLKESGLRGSLRNVSVGIDAIPDSVVEHAVAWFDATQHDTLLSSGSIVGDGGTIDEWQDARDESDNHVTGGAPTRQDDVQNGNTVVRGDGTDDFLSRGSGDFPTMSQPWTVIAVVTSVNNLSEEPRPISRADDGDANVQLRINQGDDEGWGVFAGDALDSNDDTVPAIVTIIGDGSSSSVRVNGSEVASGNAGTNNWESLGVFGRDGGSNLLDGDIGEVIPFNVDLAAENALSDEEQRLSDKWGIPLS